jgi:tetratricopeptide (TPR) repeat protein
MELGDATAEVARFRKTQPRSLERTLRRELEWIPLKAMRKERARRYKTVQELRDDIARYLRSEPLLAGPESRLYRARKFASRNRAGVAAAAVVLVAIIAASVVSVRFGIRERDARIAEAQARAEAVTQRDTAQSVNDFLIIDMLGAANPEAEDANDADPDIKVVVVLDRAAVAINARLKDNPAVRVPVLRTLGQAYLNIGRPAQSLPLLEEAVSIDDASHVLDRDSRDWLVIALSECLFRQQMSDAAVDRLTAAVGARRTSLGAAPGDALLARMLHTLGGVHKWAGKYDEAERAYTDALEIRKRILPEDSTPILSTQYNLIGIEEARARAALFAANKAKDDAAIKQSTERMREVRDRMLAHADRCTAALGESADTTLAARGEVAYMTGLCGDYDGAIRLYTEVLPVMKKALTDRHWRVLMASGNLADGYRRTGRHQEASVLLAELVDLYREVRGKTFPDTVTITDWYANSLEQTGKPDAAAAALERLFSDLKDENAKPSQLKNLAIGIANLYQRQGSVDPERAWRETAAKYDTPAPR